MTCNAHILVIKKNCAKSYLLLYSVLRHMTWYHVVYVLTLLIDGVLSQWLEWYIWSDDLNSAYEPYDFWCTYDLLYCEKCLQGRRSGAVPWLLHGGRE